MADTNITRWAPLTIIGSLRFLSQCQCFAPQIRISTWTPVVSNSQLPKLLLHYNNKELYSVLAQYANYLSKIKEVETLPIGVRMSMHYYRPARLHWYPSRSTTFRYRYQFDEKKFLQVPFNLFYSLNLIDVTINPSKYLALYSNIYLRRFWITWFRRNSTQVPSFPAH